MLYKEILYPKYMSGVLRTIYFINNQKNIWELNTKFYEKFIDTILYQIPYSFYFDKIDYYIPEKRFQFLSILPKSFIYYIVLIVSLIYFVFLRRKQILNFLKGILSLKQFDITYKEKEIFFVIFFLFYVFVFSFTNLPIYEGPLINSHRYLLPLQVPLITLSSLFFTEFWKKKGKYEKILKAFSLLVFSILLLISIFANLKLIHLEKFGEPNLVYRESCYDFLARLIKLTHPSQCRLFGDYKYYCYENFGHIFMKELRNATLAFEKCRKLAGIYSEYCYEGVARRLGLFAFGKDITENNREEIIVFDEKKKQWITTSLSSFRKNLKFNPYICEELNETYKYYCYESIPTLLSILKEPESTCNLLSKESRIYCYIGVGRSNFYQNRKIPEYIPSDCDAFFTGMGREMGYLYQNPSQAFKFCYYFSSSLGKWSEVIKKYCYEGIGWSLAERFRDNLTKVYEYCNLSKNNKDCQNGVKSFLEKKFLPEYKGCYEICYANVKENSIFDTNLMICKNTYQLNDPELNGALFIKGLNLVIDLNDAEIIKSKHESPLKDNITACCSIGIKIEDATNVTIKNFKISGFDFSILIENSINITIINSSINDAKIGIMIRDNVTKVEVINSKFNQIKESGITLKNSSHLVLLNSTLNASEIGITIENGGKFEIRNINLDSLKKLIYIKGNNFLVDCGNSFLIGKSTIFSGVNINEGNNLTFKNCKISNFNINLLVEKLNNIKIENVILDSARFRNFHAKDVENITMKNITSLNALSDNAIDFSSGYSKNIVIDNLKIYNSRMGLRIEKSNNVVGNDIEIYGIKEFGIRFEENSKNVTITNLNVKNSSFGIKIHNCSNVKIISSSFSNIDENVITLYESSEINFEKFVVQESKDIFLLNAPVAIKIKDGVMSNGKRGMLINDANGITLTNLTFDNLELHGIHLFSSKNGIIENSRFERIRNWESIYLQNVYNITISNNKFLNSSTGINIKNSLRIKIINNSFYEIKSCIKLSETSEEKVFLENNFLSDCKVELI